MGCGSAEGRGAPVPFGRSKGTGPGMTVYNAVQEEGVRRGKLQRRSERGSRCPWSRLPRSGPAEHFGWFAHFAQLDMPASSEWTRRTLGWKPTGPGLIEDLTNMKY